MFLFHETPDFLHGFSLVQITNFLAMRFQINRHLDRALRRRRLVDGPVFATRPAWSLEF